MRELTPAPASATTAEVTDGYQLCARCGNPIVQGEQAFVVRRLNDWLIYTHPLGPGCPPDAVRGWLTAGRADAIRELDNEENIFRPANAHCLDHLGLVARPCVCVLDDRHIDSELKLVTYYASDEAPASGTDLRTLLSDFYSRLHGSGKRAAAHEDGGGEWQTIIHNFVEEDMVCAIDAGAIGDALDALRDVLWSARNRSYATFRAAPAPDLCGNAILKPALIRKLRVQRPKKARLPKAPSGVLAWDGEGQAAEWALYSKRKTLKINGKWVSEFEVWAPKPAPVALDFDSATEPDRYTWENTACGWVATLKPEMVAKLNGDTKPAFSRQKHIVSRDAPDPGPTNRETQESPMSVARRILLEVSRPI
jgi:hypothetical protein